MIQAACNLINFDDVNGANPYGSLIADAHGDLFGTTSEGGGYGYGTVFEIAKTAHGYASTPTTLIRFNGANGANPLGSLIADAHGDLFGTTSAISGDASIAGYRGTVFEIAGSGFSTHKTVSCSVAESHDSFVFAPNLGENTSVHSNAHDETLDPAKSEFADLAALRAQAYEDGAHPTGHDEAGIMDHAATLAAQHAHHFLV